MISLDTFPHRTRPARGEAEGVLVLLHGRGTSENDLFPLLDILDPDARLVGVTPRAPLTLPPGGAHWYIVRQVGYPDRVTFLSSYGALTEWIDGLPDALGVPGGRLVLGGFSQGTAMSYAVALASGRPSPAALIALSGFIPSVDGFELDLDGHADVTVAIGHGRFDPIIGVEFGHDARDRLEAAGFDVTYRESPMAHSVDPDYLTYLAGWLAEKLV